MQDDLRYMVAEVERASGKKNLRSNPYYVIQDLRLYSGDSAYKFAGYADVYFFYYSDSIPMAQERKYRYDTGKRFWDRYFKKVMFLDQVPKQLKEIDSTKGP